MLQLSTFKKSLLALFFSFGTVYFSLVVHGGVWFTSQIITTLYIVIALFLLFKFLNRPNIFLVFLSSFFLGLAVWGRQTFIFYIPVFLACFYISYIHHKKLKQLVLNIGLMCFILGLFFVLSFIYNYLRFHSFLENGYSYQNIAGRFAADKSRYGYFNMAYFSHNVQYILTNPPRLIDKFPFFEFDAEGNSFLLLSPIFFLSLLIIRRKYWDSNMKVIFNLAVIASILSIALMQLFFWGTGYWQFSARYMLDIIPLLIIILALVIEDVPLLLIFLLVTISIFFNTLGTFWLNNITL